MRRKLIAAVLTAIVAAMWVNPIPANAAPMSTVEWGDCPPPMEGYPRDPRLQCAVLQVPLDYRHPGGRTIGIAISRIPAEPGQRRGILLTNPGGPGGQGLDLAGDLKSVMPPEVSAKYDLIGFDPRGIGHSAPVSCGLDPLTPAAKILPWPDRYGRIDGNVAFYRQVVAGCAANSGDLLPYISTRNTARDMDRIRAALGERKMSYFGISYGTYLGAVYLEMFPERTDRFILDSAADPNLVWYDQWQKFGIGVEQRFPDFAKWAASRNGTLDFGATPAEVRRTFDQMVSTLDRKPVVLDGFTFDGNTFRELTRALLYADFYFPMLAEYWQLGRELAAGTPPPAGVAALAADFPTVPVDNQVSALFSVICGDSSWTSNLNVYRAKVQAQRRQFPLTAGMPGNLWPCVYWPTKPLEKPVKVTSEGPRNVLILQNTRDPATPLVTALGLRRTLGQRAALVVVDQGGHGTYAYGSCADVATNQYLLDGTLPGRDQFCAAPSVAAGARASGSAPAPPRWIVPGSLL